MKTTIIFAQIIKPDYLPKTTSTSFATILNFVLAIFGAIAVIMIVYAGIQMIISQGNSEKVAQARRAIIYAFAGLVIVLLAQVIVLFIVGRAA